MKYYFFLQCELNQKTKSEQAIYSSDPVKHSIDCFLLLYGRAVFHIYLLNPRCSGTNMNKRSQELDSESLASPSTYWRNRTLHCRICLSEHWFWCFTSWWAPLGHWAEALAFTSRTLSSGNCANEEWQKKEHSLEKESLAGANPLGSIFKDKWCPFLPCCLCLSDFQSSGQRLQGGGYAVALVWLIKLGLRWTHYSSSLCLRLDWSAWRESAQEMRKGIGSQGDDISIWVSWMSSSDEQTALKNRKMFPKLVPPLWQVDAGLHTILVAYGRWLLNYFWDASVIDIFYGL